MRAMARTPDGRTALVEVKAVDAAYPLYGAVGSSPPQPLARRCWRERDGVFGAAADPALLARLDLKPGAPHHGRLRARSRFAPRSTSEPDKLAGGIGFGPRLLVSEAALRATGLLQPGSLVRWHYRLRLPDNDATDARPRARDRRARKRNCRKPAGRSARAPMLRPRSSATSSASRNTSRWSG